MKMLIVILLLLVQSIISKKYESTWDSLESRPLPDWYDKDKFGIFIHWGVFSVPARGEWFWSNWKIAKSEPDIRYMQDNYKPHFSYQDFARDFTAQYYNATEWALLFKKAGARYTVLTSKHHDGYTLWPSKYSFSWNSVDIGPHKDLIAPLADAIRKHTDLKFGLYHSLYEWFNPLYLDDRNNNFTTKRFVTFKTIPELHELVDKYLPEIIWSDGEWEANDDYWTSRDFIAWLYNESPVKDTVVVNDRWGSNTLCKHGGFLTCKDRFNPEKLQNRKWENAMTIDKRSWGFRRNYVLSDFLTSKQLIESLVTTVSCGGNVLLNVAPNSDGKIPPIYEQRLMDIGEWLKTNGEAIFETKPWLHCQNDSLTPQVWYTSKPNIIYATFYQWPWNSKLHLNCLDSLENIKIEFLGYQNELNWSRINNVVEVILPHQEQIHMNWAWSLKVTVIPGFLNSSVYLYDTTL